MTARRIYLLWEHDEHGPENLVATDDPAKLPDLLEPRLTWPHPDWPNYVEQQARATVENEAARAKLKAALEANQPGEISLFRGWGGTNLQIIDLV